MRLLGLGIFPREGSLSAERMRKALNKTVNTWINYYVGTVNRYNPIKYAKEYASEWHTVKSIHTMKSMEYVTSATKKSMCLAYLMKMSVLLRSLSTK